MVKEPVKIVFIKEFCQLFRNHMTLFCEMGRGYGVAGDGHESSKNNACYYAKESQPMFYTNHKQKNFVEFASMCSSLTNTFIGFVFKAFTPAGVGGGDWAEDPKNDCSNELLLCYLNELRNLLDFFRKSPESEKIKSVLSTQLTTMQICCMENVLINAHEELNKIRLE